ncbi:MAG: aminopeptidase P family protein [Rhodobiaceae bacterium]|nr:aminopeptidase P family protein [Rhodobiaceae bacterium]
MFQTFDAISDPARGKERIAALRAELEQRGLEGFIIPHSDEYQNESLPPSAQRLYWVTGFTGSAGCAIVLKDRASIFVDGRYTLQVGEQVDTGVLTVRHLIEEPPYRWLERELAFGDRFGYDPRLHTSDNITRLEKACASAGARLVACDTNPVDAIWSNRPAPPAGMVSLHAPEYAGEAAADKLTRLRRELEHDRVDMLVMTQPESIAWLLNIRGADIVHTPVPLCYAIVPAMAEEKPRLFIEPRKLDGKVRQELGKVATLHEEGELAAALAELKARDLTIRLDPMVAAHWFAQQLTGGLARIQNGADPCVMMKARKNATEISGARAAHIRDGAAMARFLCWFDREVPRGGIDEITAVQRLEAYRVETGQIKDLSFDTISASGPNGAIVHYRVTHASNRQLRNNSLYLVDSGAQYLDGTTDVTRTIAIGQPSDEMRDRYTRVLKGHIAIATARFPIGTTGTQLDPFARRALWDAGIDYDHGTGHGVGSYLSVHEGPARIAKTQSVALEQGMILSNEPGYYKAGEYGIRIENLVLVREPVEIKQGEYPLLSFETLTMVPIDTRPIAPGLLTPQEIQWVDAYHEQVRDALTIHLNQEEQDWLARATMPIGRH